MSHITPPPPLQAAQTSRADPGTSALEFHPIADMFPPMEGTEFDALVADIKANGLRHPIVLYEDMILDGRNRSRACLAAGVEPVFTPFRGDDPVAFVISTNLLRRHLSVEQRRDLIAKLIKAQPEKPDLQIAKTIKVSPTTVGTVRRKMEAKGDVSKLETRTDTKGRKQPTEKPRAQQRHRRDAGVGATLAATASSPPPPPTADLPDEHVAPPEEAKRNVVFMIERHRAQAEACRKVIKASRFSDEARDEIIPGVDGLIRKWKTVRSILGHAGA